MFGTFEKSSLTKFLTLTSCLPGFPCQAFSVAGYRQGFDDEKGRGNLYFELERIIKDKMPPIVFLENVKNLLGHDKGRTFSVISKSLEALGYSIHYKVLNARLRQYSSNQRTYLCRWFLDERALQRFQFPAKSISKQVLQISPISRPKLMTNITTLTNVYSTTNW